MNDMEEWKVIQSFPDYMVSDAGRVKRGVPDLRGRVGKVLKPYYDRYVQFTLYRERASYTVLAHRLVCEAFHGPQPTPRHEVAHCNGDGWNNRAENLRWSTHVENEADKAAHGTSLAGRPSWVPDERRAKGNRHGRYTKPETTARGERIGLSKLTEDDIIKIRLDQSPRKQIAAAYGVTVTMIGYIQRGISWTHVPMPQQQGAHP